MHFCTDFPVLGGLHSHFTYSSWDNISMIWTDKVSGSQKAAGFGVYAKCSTGPSGASGEICELRGTTLSWLYFGESALPTVFTMCSVTRYAGYWKGHIITGHPNIIHGHSNGTAGTAHYDNARMTFPGIQVPAVDTDWLIFCGQNAAPWHFYANGQPVGIVNSGTTVAGGNALGVNYCPPGVDWTCNRSDFGIVEIAIWNRTLSQNEIIDVQNYFSDMIVTSNAGEIHYCFGESYYFSMFVLVLSVHFVITINCWDCVQTCFR